MIRARTQPRLDFPLAVFFGVAVAVAVAVACLPTPSHAQVPGELPAAQRGGTFHEPPARVDRAFVPQGPDVPGEPQPRENRLQLRLALDMPLQPNRRGTGFDTQGPRTGRGATLQAEFSARPFTDAGWLAQLRFFRDLSSREAWHPDFTYVFGYEVYEPGTFSLVYSNYSGTRLRPFRANFREGQWIAGYKFELPAALRRVFLAGEEDAALCAGQLHLSGRYVDETGAANKGRPALSLGCRYTHRAGYFAHFTAFAYPRDRQLPWDPDFTYGAGYSLPAVPGLTVEYGNYSGSRWPGRTAATGEGGFGGGSITVSWVQHW